MNAPLPVRKDLETAWNDLAAKLRAYIRTRVADHAAAEDILQDVFLKAQRGLDRLDSETKIHHWLYLIARNTVIDYYRTTRQTTEVPESLPADAPMEDETEREQLTAAFRRMIAGLPEPYRQALVLTEFEGLTQKELAERTGVSLSGAKSRVQRARQQLRQMLFQCCQFEFDGRGKVIDCKPRSVGSCEECA